MDILTNYIQKLLASSYNYLIHVIDIIKIITIETSAYNHKIISLEQRWENNKLSILVNYRISGYRNLRFDSAKSLNSSDMLYLFKPKHAQMIVTLTTLESLLEYTPEQRIVKLKKYLTQCNESLYTEHNNIPLKTHFEKIKDLLWIIRNEKYSAKYKVKSFEYEHKNNQYTIVAHYHTIGCRTIFSKNVRELDNSDVFSLFTSNQAQILVSLSTLQSCFNYPKSRAQEILSAHLSAISKDL